MILSDILGSEVTDEHGDKVGQVIDARFRLSGRTQSARAELIGLIVSPRSAASFLGYERTAASRPVIIDKLLRVMHRGSFLVRWEDIARIDDVVRLRRGYERLPSELDPARLR